MHIQLPRLGEKFDIWIWKFAISFNWSNSIQVLWIGDVLKCQDKLNWPFFHGLSPCDWQNVLLSLYHSPCQLPSWPNTGPGQTLLISQTETQIFNYVFIHFVLKLALLLLLNRIELWTLSKCINLQRAFNRSSYFQSKTIN